MARRAYVPSGKSDPGALVRIGIFTLVAGLLTGLFLGFVSQWLSLLIIFPVVLGGVIGGIGASQVKSRHVRQPFAVALIGLATGILGEATVHLMKYEHVRSELAKDFAVDPVVAGFVEDKGLDAVVDASLSLGQGLPPLIGYLQLAAQNGITITKAGHSSSSSPTLTGVGVYALWLANFLLVCGMAAWLMASEARKPFCESCVAWYDQTHVVGFGSGDSATVKQAVLHLDLGQHEEAVRSLGTSDAKSASRVTMLSCSKCNAHEPLLELTRVTGLKGNKPQEKKMFVSLISASEAAALREATKPATS
jgi:hypothetical protein